MIPLRPPNEVMRLKRLGASHQTRLSFMRVLLRKLHEGAWKTDRPVWDIDAKGVGHAVYRIKGEGQTYSLVAFAHDLPADQRSDRVIAERWDATFALVDGEAKESDIARLAANVPLQEAGRVSDKELVLSRANRSVRLWEYVVNCLAKGEQPERSEIEKVGYLMRTTAVYGSGKFGAADFNVLKGRSVMDGPFRAEMLAVWLIRTFVMDLVQHMARAKSPNAARLDPELRSLFGIGNSTGLGMAPFLVNHPRLLNAWITAQETALARVRALPLADATTRDAFSNGVSRAEKLVTSWTTDHPYQIAKVTDLANDIEKLRAFRLPETSPWNALYLWSCEHLSVEGQELVVSIMIEPYGALVDDLADTMTADETLTRIDGAMRTSELLRNIKERYDWALSFHGTKDQTARFWYTSEAKLEPRLGERYEEAGAELEQPLDIARAVASLARALASKDEALADFLLRYPEHRHVVRRIQSTENAPYAEIRDNLISADLMPVDMLRCKLAFFGATRFDPRSDRWLRITMFQGAPYPDELFTAPVDDWALPAWAA